MDSDKALQSAVGRDSVYPLAFFKQSAADTYMRDPAVRSIVEFFKSKGLAALKEEDRLEQWYEDWIAYQREHGLYASLLSPRQYSSCGNRFDLLRYTRFLEVFAYCSPAHAYSMHVTFLGLFSILMGSNQELKQRAVAALEAGDLLAFGVSERDHGSDLMANEFLVGDAKAEGLIAGGAKYYIGNSDVASIISVLGRRANSERTDGRVSRAPFILLALRPKLSPGFRSLGKIRTLGVRAANVGAFEVKNHPLTRDDVIAEGRNAWDAVFGTVTLGKFFLGFGSIGICEHACEEAAAHLQNRMLYGNAVIDMPHIRSNMAQAYARLTAMKLFAYRALDYVHSSTATDRRYQLFCAVQKAKVSTEGLKVMSLLQECIGAKGFESDTYFEMALRDIQLIPSLEGSMHINLGQAVQFIPRYFDRPDSALPEPASLIGGEIQSLENIYLMESRAGGTHTISFRPFGDAYHSLKALPNVASFARQVEAFQEFMRHNKTDNGAWDMQVTMALGQCFSTIAYGQLVAENSARLKMPDEWTSVIFSTLVADLSTFAMQLASIPQIDESTRKWILRIVEIPKTSASDWDWIGQRL